MKFLKQVSLYTFVGFFGAGINFFVTPVLSHYLSPADYGLLSLFNTYITILIPLISMSAYSLLNVDYFKEKNKAVFASEFASIQVIPVITTFFLILLTWKFYGRFADDLELKGTGVRWGFVAVLISFFSIYFDQFIQFLILQRKAASFAIYTIVKASLEVALTFYFVIVKGLNWEGRMYSWFITTGLFSLLGFIYFYKQGFFNGFIKMKYIKEGIIFGSPLILHGIGKFVVNQSDRIFIVKMVSLNEAGIYNIGYTVGMMVLIVISAFFSYFTPFIMERLANLTADGKFQIVKMSYIYGFGCLLLLAFIMLLSPLFFKYFIDARYQRGISYVFWIALGYCFWGGYMLFSGFIFFYKRNSILGWLSIINVTTNLLFNYFFIKWFGAIGAAYATALSFFMTFAIIAFKSNQLIKLPWFQFNAAMSVKL